MLNGDKTFWKFDLHSLDFTHHNSQLICQTQIVWSGNINCWSGKSIEKSIFSMNCRSPDKHAVMKVIFWDKTYFLQIIIKTGYFTTNSMPNHCVDHNKSFGEILKDR